MHRGPTTKHQQGGYDLSERRHQEGVYRDPWNRGPERNWEENDIDRSRHNNFYENYGHNQRGKESRENFLGNWPTLWEERLLKRLRHIERMEANGWGPERK